MPMLRRKAFAYITHDDRLLVFRHPAFADAGIQVPAGTVREGERPDVAAIWEAFEETGLPGLTLVRPLGEHVRDMSDFGLDERHHRYYYHLQCASDPPATWQHYELDPADGSPAPILFEFFWVSLPDSIPPLMADHDKQLPHLISLLSAEGVITQSNACE